MGLRGARVLFFVVAVFVVIVDRISKALITANVPLDTQFQVLPFLWIQDGQNSGAAFGIGRSATLLFTVASVVVSVALVVYALRTKLRPWTALCLGLILGGAVGNGYDRLVHGQVTDFIALPLWPTFNLADSAVTIGIVLLIGGYVLRPRSERSG
ncbi:MAG: signal peptidase II [Candidatus Dormiibacterota bacterium]